MTKTAQASDTADDMAKEETTTVAFRLPNSLVKRLDEYVKRLDAGQPGMTHSRTDAVRVLLMRGLDEMDEPAGKKSKR